MVAVSSMAQQYLIDPPQHTAGRCVATDAAPDPILRTRSGVDYYPLECRTLLNRCASRVPKPFVWTINPYRGCELGCVYCFARYTHEFMGLHHWSDFERKIYVKQGAAPILRRELAHGINPSEPIALGTASDLYQPAERTFRVTRSLLEVFAEFQGLQISLATKSDLVTRDIDLLTELSQRHRLRVNISVTTPRSDLARRLEPRAPTVAKRMEALRALREAGLSAGLLIMPVLPCLTDGMEDLDRLIGWAAECGTGWVGVQPLWLRSSAAARFYPFLRRHAPHLVERYRRCYDRHMHTPALYRDWLAQRVETLRERYGIPVNPSSGCDHSAHRQSWTQAALFSLN